MSAISSARRYRAAVSTARGVVFMRIACVDKTAADRVKLQKLIDESYEKCRASVGHLSLLQTVPASRDEVLINDPYELYAIGPSFSIEEAYLITRELREAFPGIPVLVVLSPEAYSLRTLRRFDKLADQIVSADDQPVRLIHAISSLDFAEQQRSVGHLIVVKGVKGGVGATSIVSGLAHAAEAIEKSAVVIDLSLTASFVQYMGTKRWHSPEYTALLVDSIIPDRAMVERCISRAPNGVSVLLPPSGGTEVREMWLRDEKRFEITLRVIEILKEMFDIVLVDSSSAEGVLSFALNTRANHRLLVTSNDPASVHLLNTTLGQLVDLPGIGDTQILINLLSERGLTKDDVSDFLILSEHYKEESCLLDPCQFDPRGRNWIGTGNTFYTECSTGMQRYFERALETLLSGEVTSKQQSGEERERTLLPKLRNWKRNGARTPKKLLAPVRALPLETARETPLIRPVTKTLPEAANGHNGTLATYKVSANGNDAASTETTVLYEAPRPVVNEERSE